MPFCGRSVEGRAFVCAGRACLRSVCFGRKTTLGKQNDAFFCKQNDAFFRCQEMYRNPARFVYGGSYVINSALIFDVFDSFANAHGDCSFYLLGIERISRDQNICLHPAKRQP